MTVDEKILEIKMKIEGANSVKELKDVIAELTPEMTTADKTAEEYAKTVDLMTKAQEKLTTAMKAGKSQISAQEGSYNALVNKMAALKKVQKAVTDDDTRSRLAVEINTINDQLKAYDQANGVYVRNVGNYKSALDGFDGTVVKFGDSMREAMETIEPTKAKFESIQKISAGVASGFAAIQGAAALLGAENEELEKTFVKVQSAMAIAQGVAGLGDLYEGFAKWGVAFGDVASKAEEVTDAVETVSDVTEAAAAASNVAAAANTANAAATAADTTAKGAQVVATEGATVAQKGLNAAMKANPIGLVIVAVTALVGVFVWLKDEIIELLGGTEKLSVAWDKFKVVFAGVGNVIKQIVLGPIKQLIISIRTVVETVSNLAQGDFKGAWNAIKDGFTDTVDSIKDSLDVVGNYQEAAAEKQAEIQDKARREEAEKREKELNDYIKDMEAKSDSDWKYTEEGKKAYEELYKKRMEMYDKDSDEYRQAQRDLWTYNKDYQDRITDKETEAHKKRQEALKQALEKEKEIREKALQEYQNLVTSYTQTDADKLTKEQSDRMKALQEVYDKGLISYEEYLKQRQLLLDKMGQEEQEFYFETQLKEFALQKTQIENYIKSIQKTYELGYANFLEIVGKHNSEFKEKMGSGIYGDDVEKQIAYITALYDTQVEGLLPIIEKLQYRYQQFVIEYGADSELAINAAKELYNTLFEQSSLLTEKTKAISDVRIKALEEEIALEEKAMMQNVADADMVARKYEAENNGILEFSNNYLSQMYKWWEAENNIHNARIESLNKMRNAYLEASMDMQLAEEERVKAKAEAAKLLEEIEKEETNHTIITNQRKAEASQNYVNAIQDSLSGIGQILGSVADAWETSIQAQVSAGEISEEEGEKQMENMKGIQSAIALINAFSSAVSAYNSLASIPYVGVPLGIAASAAALASGLAQVAAINKVKKGDKGGNSSVRYAEVNPSTTSDFIPQMVQNTTGLEEQENLANALTKSPIKAYVVESEMTEAQKKADRRNAESTF